MKDTLLTARRKKTEIYTWLVCLAIAIGINVYAIITYNASFMELITSFFYVLAFSVALYLAWSVIRLGFHALRKGVKGVKRR